MTKEEIIAYWTRSAAEDVLTAESLFESKRFLPCLFYCHLFVEKILKALIVGDTGEPAPYGHKLLRLAELAGIEWDKTQGILLADLTRFNIRARYEEYKQNIYKEATQLFTKSYLTGAKELYLWLKKKL